jgi:BlaI family transcriptional regulator, penicillinase repressor
MARPPATQPTEVELQILRLLWELGPSGVRQIHTRLEAEKGTNYSTTVKMLAVMLEKGLVTRDEAARPHVYRAAVTQERARKKMLHELIEKLYDGSASSLVMHALSSKKASPDELNEIRRLLDELERKQP